MSPTNKPAFFIPFRIEAGSQRPKEVRLYVSTDQGRSWNRTATAGPERQGFDFHAQLDGLYWFAVQTVDLNGQAYPPTMDGAQPGLKVAVDTKPPAITLRPLANRGGTVGVEWEIHDDGLDLASLVLEQRLPGAAEWQNLVMDKVAVGQRYWTPPVGGAIEVRLWARDRVGNAGEAKVTVTAAAPDNRSPPPNNTNPVTQPPNPNVRLVNSKRISLNYKVEEQGPSGISVVELWYTPDTRNWQKYTEHTQNDKPPFVFDVNGEGVYGFTLVVRSGVGLGDRPPQVGDQPQIWVEVDLTPPVVRLQAVDVGRGSETGNLAITWTASDKNLGPKPIKLSYAALPTDPWRQIVAETEHTGRYVWKMPPDVPYKFLVKIEAADRAGNVAADQTQTHVIVDLAQPKARILEVGPAATR